jgi:hypothetical protein
MTDRLDLLEQGREKHNDPASDLRKSQLSLLDFAQFEGKTPSGDGPNARRLLILLSFRFILPLFPTCWETLSFWQELTEQFKKESASF